MTKRRMIHDEFFQSEGVAAWTMRQRLLVIGMISIADDQGRLKGNPLWLRSQIFPYDMLSIDDISSDLAAIAATNDTVWLYQVDGRDYIQLVNWWDYQSPQWAKASRLPAPTGWQDRIRQMIYEPKRWVMTINWPGSDDKTTYEELEPLPNVLGNASPISNINTNTNNKIPKLYGGSHYELDPSESPSSDYFEQRNDMMIALDKVAREKLVFGTDSEERYKRNAEACIESGYTVESISGFISYWDKLTDKPYEGKPWLKSVMDHMDEYQSRKNGRAEDINEWAKRAL